MKNLQIEELHSFELIDITGGCEIAEKVGYAIGFGVGVLFGSGIIAIKMALESGAGGMLKH